MQITLFLSKEPFGRVLKLNLPLKRPIFLSISAQVDLFFLAIHKVTATSLPNFPNYGAGLNCLFLFATISTCLEKKPVLVATKTAGNVPRCP